MKFKIILRLIALFTFFINLTILSSGQITLDHRIFLDEIKNSSTKIYEECLQKYNSYLKEHPDDILVQIEKCKFIQLAQYDEDMDFNPNQEDFDSCFISLTNLYPNNPEVILYQTENLWGDELKEIFKSTEQLIMDNPVNWTKANLGIFYFKISEQYYNDSEYKDAESYIQKAIENDEDYESSLLYAQILKELKRTDEALKVLKSQKDTTGDTWQLVQKANLLLELKAYSEAVELYNLILEIDSSYNNNYELAKSLEGVGKYDLSRKYLLRDTSNIWSKEYSFKNLLIHDLKYCNGDTSAVTYNRYRNLGYKVDPLSLYRLRLFLKDPLQPWKGHDILGLLTFIGIIIVLLLIPSIWILPIYFIGTYWGFISQGKTYKAQWGLKWFWVISSGYLFSSLIVGIFNPDYFYSQFNHSYYESELNQVDLSNVTLISILTFGAIGLISLFKKDLKVLLSKNWSIKKSVFLGLGLVLAFKIISTIYIKIGSLGLGISIDELTSIPNILLSSRQEIEALIANYGKLIGFILICIFVPLYEEVIFRGIIIDSCQKYINFNSANFIQASLFGLIHLNLFLFPIFFMFGIITGLMRKRSQGLLPGIAFHSINNVLSILLLLIN
jgi:uncharacterized protein